MSLFGKRWQAYWLKAIEKRSPYLNKVTLNQKKIYIIPSKVSLGYLTCAGLLVIAGINYQNNLVYGLAFWMVAIFVVNIIFTFRNLAGVRFSVIKSDNAKVGENINFTVRLDGIGEQSKFNLFLESTGGQQTKIDLSTKKYFDWIVCTQGLKRGPVNAPRIKIFTTYPLGLAYAWGYVFLNANAWCFPESKWYATGHNSSHDSDEEKQDRLVKSGSHDFYQLANYQQGDKLNRIYWPALAKNNQWLVKEFVDYHGDELWLNFDDYPELQTENRLQYLAYLIEKAQSNNNLYGLKIAATVIEPNNSMAHQNICMLALAKYGFEHE